MVLYFIGTPLHNETHIWNISFKNFFSYIKVYARISYRLRPCRWTTLANSMCLKPALAVVFLLAPSAGLPKIAIFLFYLRISPSGSFQICTRIVIGLTWAFMISIFCAILFSCYPVHRLWDPTVEGWCIASLPIILSVPIISTVLDLILSAPSSHAYQASSERTY